MSYTQDFVQRFVTDNPDLVAAPANVPELSPKKALRVPVVAHLVIGCLLAFGIIFALLLTVDPEWLRQNMPAPGSDKERWEQRAQRAGVVAASAVVIYLLMWWLVGSTIIHRREKVEAETSAWKRVLL